MPEVRLAVFPAFHKISGRPVDVAGEGAAAVRRGALAGAEPLARRETPAA